MLLKADLRFFEDLLLANFYLPTAASLEIFSYPWLADIERTENEYAVSQLAFCELFIDDRSIREVQAAGLCVRLSVNDFI